MARVTHQPRAAGVCGEASHIELLARSVEQGGKARATVARRLSTIAGFYRYCAVEQLIPASPAVHVRRPRLDYESNATGLDRNELGMFLVQAGLAGGRDHGVDDYFASPIADWREAGIEAECTAGWEAWAGMIREAADGYGVETASKPTILRPLAQTWEEGQCLAPDV